MLDTLEDVARSRAVLAGSMAILAQRNRSGRHVNTLFLRFVEYGQQQLPWLDGALAGATALARASSEVDEPHMRWALLRMSGPKLEAALLGIWMLGAWVDLLNLTYAVLPHSPPYSVERLMGKMFEAEQRMHFPMESLASQEPWRIKEAAGALPGLLESFTTHFHTTQQEVRVALEGHARMMEAFQVYELVLMVATMKLAMPRLPPAAPLVVGTGLLVGADGLMVGTQVVVTAEWVELIRRLVRAGVLSVPVASAAVRMQAGPLLMARADKDLPQGVRDALGDSPEVRAMRETDRAGAGMAEPPRHHVLPREHREWFEQRGFTADMDIDQFCVRMEPADHQAIHGGGSWRLGRTWPGEWNRLIMEALREAEVRTGRRLTRNEILDIVAAAMGRSNIPLRFIPWRGR